MDELHIQVGQLVVQRTQLLIDLPLVGSGIGMSQEPGRDLLISRAGRLISISFALDVWFSATMGGRDWHRDCL